MGLLEHEEFAKTLGATWSGDVLFDEKKPEKGRASRHWFDDNDTELNYVCSPFEDYKPYRIILQPRDWSKEFKSHLVNKRKVL